MHDPLKIGLIDLDTSHARSFTQRLNAMDRVVVSSIVDGGRVRTEEQIKEFCQEFGCTRVDSVEQIAQLVDACMILSADWESHLPHARPLLEAGVPTYIDKPLAGSVAALNELVAIAERTQTPICGGSGWRFNAVIQHAHNQHRSCSINNVFAMVGQQDIYFYGIHIVEAVLGLLGPGIESVNADPYTKTAEFRHARGGNGSFYFRGSRPMRGLVFDVDGVEQHAFFTGEDIHNGICQMFIEMVNTQFSPISPAELIESCMVLLAIIQSMQTGLPVDIKTIRKEAMCGSQLFMEQYCEMTNSIVDNSKL